MAHTKVTKTYSQNTGVANTFSYSGSFDVFKATEVQVELDNVALTYTASTINESASPREYTVDTSASTIHVGGADLSSGTLVLRPVTDMGAPTPRATYAPGSSITSADLNNNQTQLMRKAMEYDEQKLSSLGGTMTGHLTIGEDQTIIFEGATDDAYETTLTVTDPTADRTVTLPNVTGTVVTTGDTGTVATGMIAADAITGAKIADDALDSEHYTDGSIDAAHLASSSVTTAKIAADNITSALIADDQIDSEHYIDGSIDTAHFAAGSVDATALGSNAVTTAKINADAVTGAKIADDAIDSEHLAADSIDAEHYAPGSVDATALASDAVTFAKIGCEQTTISDTDTSIPTSGAVVDYVTAAITPLGGFEAIATEDVFPTTVPDAGVIVSIADATEISVNSSGVSTNCRTDGNGSDNVTINGFPSILRGGVGSNADPYVLPASSGLLVVSTGSSHTYTYHRLVATTEDIKLLSDTVESFKARYRVASSAPSSDNTDGDIYYNTSNDTLYVYDGSQWEESVTSTPGNDTVTGAKIVDNAIDSEHYTDGSIDHVHLAADAVDGDNIADDSINSEHYVDGSIDAAHIADDQVTAAKLAHTAVTAGSYTAADITVDAQGRLTSASNGAIATSEIAADAITGAKIADDAIDSEHYTDGSIDTAHIADNQITLAKMAGGTDGQIITYDASGDPIAVGPGTDGQVLTSTGAGSPPAFEDAGGGGVTSDAQYNTLAGTNAGEDLTSGGTNNTLIGYDAGKELTDKDNHTFIGYKAGEDCTTGEANTCVGAHAGMNITTALSSTIVGQQAGIALTTGNNNVLIGQANGDALTTGYENTSIGTLCFSATGTNAYRNVAIGQGALNNNTAHGHVAVGNAAMESNTGGTTSVAVGWNALAGCTTANNNVAIGHNAQKVSTTTHSTVCVGMEAGVKMTTGADNTFVGFQAGAEVTTAFNNTLIGNRAGDNLTTGHSNVILGHYDSGSTLTTGNTNAIIHGNVSAAASQYEFVIGPIAGKGNGTFYAGGTNGAYNQANNSSWSTTSDRRIKKNIVDNNDGLSKINSIRVRNFEYREKDEIDYTEFTEDINPDSIGVTDQKGTQLGVIAQEIQEVLPNVVTQSTTGQYTVNPDNITWYLVNAVKELSAKVTELEAKLNG